MLTTAAERFAMARPQYEVPWSAAAPSPQRPYGLRFVTALGSTTAVEPPSFTYDPVRQLGVDTNGAPRFRTERLFRTTTGSSDGGSGPMEEWTYDK